jgi:hypothetical protein
LDIPQIIAELEADQRRLEAALAALQRIGRRKAKGKNGRRRKMSAEVRRKMSEAQKRRWAARRASK